MGVLGIVVVWAEGGWCILCVMVCILGMGWVDKGVVGKIVEGKYFGAE